MNTKKLFASAAAAAALCMASGCATVEFTSPGSLDGIVVTGATGNPSHLIMVDTVGYYMFWTIPLVTGDLRWNEDTKSIEGGTVFFQDQVGLDEVQNAMVKYAESRNCDLADVSFYDSDTSYAGPSYSGIIGIFFGSSRMGVSAVLIPRKDKAGSADAKQAN